MADFTPRIIDKWLHVSQDGYQGVHRRYIGRFGMSPKIIVLHIQEGNNWGSWQHFHVVSASSTVLIGKNGDIWRLVPESDSPWTNGDVANPTAKGWDVINKWGADPNVYSLTIETEGFTGDPVPEAQFKSIVWQIREWMDNYGISADYVLRHADINSVSRPRCPGDALYNAVMAEIRKVPTPQPVYQAPNKVMNGSVVWDGTTTITVGDTTFHGEVREVTLNKDDVGFHSFATFSSAPTRSTLDNGTRVAVLGWADGEAKDGEGRWWITKYFSRLWVGDTDEKPTPVDVPEPKPDFPAGAKFVNGRVYYPTQEDDGSRRKVVTIGKANLRAEPSTSSMITGVAPKGTEYNVRYWTFGDAVKGENIWWLIYEGGDPFKGELKHLWIAATVERPN